VCNERRAGAEPETAVSCRLRPAKHNAVTARRQRRSTEAGPSFDVYQTATVQSSITSGRQSLSSTAARRLPRCEVHRRGMAERFADLMRTVVLMTTALKALEL
jgi:hypothetical protein